MKTIKYKCCIHDINQMIELDDYAPKEAIKQAERKVSNCIECSKERYLQANTQ